MGMQDDDADDDFNQRASMMSMGGRERRTALGRGTVSAGASGEADNDMSDMEDPMVARQKFIEAASSRHSTI